MQYGIKIRRYHTDNGIFKSKAFMNDVDENYQTIDFCGLDAHHQNGIAEWAIHTIIESAQTLLLHAHFLWPDKINYNIWPFAVRHSVNIYNNLPQKDLNYCTPEQVFSGVTHPT